MASSTEMFVILGGLRTSNPKLVDELESLGVKITNARFTSEDNQALAQRLNDEVGQLSPLSRDRANDKLKEIVRDIRAGVLPKANTDTDGQKNSPAPEAAPVSPFPAPDAEPAAPPPTVQWQEQTPTEPWLPPSLQELCGKLLEDVCEKPVHLVREPALPGWRVLAGTRRGRLHAHHGTYREDAFAHGGDAEHGRFWVFCVCDGAGSSRLSRVGSEVTSRGMVRRLSDYLRGKAEAWAALSFDELNKALQAAVDEAARDNVTFLEQAAAAAGAEPKDFRCTLLMTILYHHGGALLACLSQVGDGFIAGLTADGAARRYADNSSPSGDFSGEVRCFVPDPGSSSQAAQLLVIPDIANRRALMLCTDGIEDPFFPVDANVGLLFRQFTGDGPEEDGRPGVHWPEPPGGPLACEEERMAKDRLARWLAFEKKGENDDRTVMFIHRVPAGA